MVCVNVKMKYSGIPLKRTPVELTLDESNQHIGPIPTDRSGKACFEMLTGIGKIYVAGVERYQGRLDGLIDIELRNLTENGYDSGGAASDDMAGNTAYPNMETCVVPVNGKEVLTDSEGYLVDPGDWSEDFARQQAKIEGLELTQEQWEVIRFLRSWYADHRRQATVRDMIKHFRTHWDKSRGSNR